MPKNRIAETKRQVARLRKGGWTMHDISLAVGVTERTVQHWRAGTREIDLETAPALAALPTKRVKPGAKVSA